MRPPSGSNLSHAVIRLLPAWLRRRAAVRNPAIVVLVMLAGGTAAQLTTYEIALKREISALGDVASRRLQLASAELAAPLARFEYLPALLETTPAVMKLLNDHDRDDGSLRIEANRALERINAVAGADMLFVLEPTGRALAAADSQNPDTTVGNDYRYRPYMKQALAQGRGQFFGVGITSRKAGYFLSYALREGAGIAGVATVKINLESAEKAWATQPGDVLVTDARGVVILSSRPEWKFHALRPFSDAERAQILEERPYAVDLPPLPWVRAGDALTSGHKVWIDNDERLVTSRTLSSLGWTLRAVDTLAPAKASARSASMIASLGAAVLCLLASLAWLSRRAGLQKIAAQAQLQEAYETLEQRVKERTAQLSELNESLAAEVETRKAVELNLKETQGELVHAGKMAVLGQISAGLAHELNQPLAALRTLADNSIVLLEQRRFDDTRANLERIGHLVGRLGDTTRRLKGFAHKPPSGESAEPTPVAPAIASAQALLSERMRRQRVAFESAVEPEAQVVMANPAALEQVMVNLIANAIDAMAGCPVKRLQVSARRVGEFVQIKVTDTGCGIAPEVMPRLFEAFATSKPRGAGLGLGLMISQRIAQDFRGCIRAANNPDGGATFIVEWPVARLPKAQ